VALAAAGAAMLAMLAAPTGASASVSPPLPGPPPTAGLDFPAAPAPGTVPTPGPLGPAASLPTKIGGAGLRSGFVLVSGRELTLAIACSSGGRVSLSASALGPGVLARGSYSCRDRQGSAQMSLAPAAASRLAALRSTIGRVALGFGNAERFSVTLETRPTAPIDWSSGGMECSVLAPYEAYLVAPDFTVTPPAIIDVRPWVAWYTSANGWRWLGTTGVNQSSWYRWYATPGGTATWVTPNGALNPWTWAPVRVRAGLQIHAIAVFELIYWYAHPRYIWGYTPAQPTASAPTSTYCLFP